MDTSRLVFADDPQSRASAKIDSLPTSVYLSHYRQLSEQIHISPAKMAEFVAGNDPLHNYRLTRLKHGEVIPETWIGKIALEIGFRFAARICQFDDRTSFSNIF